VGRPAPDAAEHGHLGWTLSAATAETIADTIQHGTGRRKPAGAGAPRPAPLRS
jgi:D-amino-acid dehydrogenase